MFVLHFLRQLFEDFLDMKRQLGLSVYVLGYGVNVISPVVAFRLNLESLMYVGILLAIIYPFLLHAIQ